MHDEKSDKPGLNRRDFIGALGAAAAASTILESLASAKSGEPTQYWYQNSFGDIVPAGRGAIALGVHPPRVSGKQHEGNPKSSHQAGCSPTSTGTYYAAPPQYNILFVMVDQMRAPGFWPSPSGATTLQQLPNIAKLAAKSFYFPNYFTAATVCGPARATLLTGLYTQQTSFYRSQSTGSPYPGTGSPSGGTYASPPLLPYNLAWPAQGAPGFPTIGNVLSQCLPVGTPATGSAQYDCTWIGKWHLSCVKGYQDGSVGQNGPSDYGFGNKYCLPNAGTPLNVYPRGGHGYPSPNGLENEGAGGDFLDSLEPPSTANDVPNFYPPPLTNPMPSLIPQPSLIQLNDAAIAYAFTNYWLPNQTASPWFCAVSFINPHDISDFPYPYDLTSGSPYNCTPEPFCAPGPAYASPYGYQPPPLGGGSYTGNNCETSQTQCVTDGDTTSIPSISKVYGSLPANWNWEDPEAAPYTSTSGKPGLQAYFENSRNQLCGTIASPSANPLGWLTFLNYYVWMQACVDVQVGNVLNALAASKFAPNTVVVFTSDHGDYGGSHNLHAKGGGLYEEVINVPLYVSFPGQAGPAVIPYVCSSVDLLPFFYSLALGNDSWRNNPNDLVSYLSNREAIMDAILEYDEGPNQCIRQRRVCQYLKCADPVPGLPSTQPFILNTADDYSSATVPNVTPAKPQPSHAIAFRTCDTTDPITPTNGQTAYGGGKLGVYSYWQTCGAKSGPILGIPTSPIQYEFYNYSSNPSGGDKPTPNINTQEMGNQYFPGSGNAPKEASLYQTDFYSTTVQSELYSLYTNNGALPPNAQVVAAMQIAFNNYIDYLSCSNELTDSSGYITTCLGATCTSYNP